MLTIGQLATYADVTVRTIRHYHQIGLLAEPGRDHSGYRRYDSRHLIRVVRIRTLAAAGVPLSRIGDLLDASSETFTDAIGGIDAELRARIRQLREHRRRLGQLQSGERLVLPAAVCDLLDRMRALGFSEAIVGLQRDGCVLLETVYPGASEYWEQWQRQALADPEYIDLYRAMDALFDADPDDPRLDDFADRAVSYALAEAGHWDAGSESWQDSDATAFQLINGHGLELSPAWRQIARLVEQKLTERGRLP